MASGGVPPPCCKIFSWKNRLFVCIWFLDLVTKIQLANFKNLKGSSCSTELSRDLFSTGGKRKFAIFEVFRAYLTEFSIFLHEIFIARSYRVLATHIKSLFVSALIGLETRSRFWPFFVDFCRFWNCPFWHKPLTYDNDFFY